MILLTIVFAILNGFVHAFIWSKKGAESLDSNEHMVTTAHMYYPFVMAIYVYLFNGHLIEILLNALLLASLHPSFYYYAMNKVIPGSYPKELLSEPSLYSTAKINLQLWKRITLFVISLIMLILWYVFH